MKWRLFAGDDRAGWSRRLSVTAAWLVLAYVVPAGSARAQLPAAPKQVPATTAGPTAADRQKAMQADAAHLLQLATQLKGNVDRSRKDELSLQVIREADEIEKLARSARSRIR